MLFLSISGVSFSQSSAELKRRKAALTREIESLKRQQNKVVGNKRLSLRQIDALNTKIRLREEKINTINSEVRLLNSQITETSNTVQSLRNQLSKLKKEYAAMILFAFRNQSSYSKLMFIFASESFNQAYKRLKYLQQVSDYRKKQASYIRETQAELKEKIVRLDESKRSKNDLLESQEEEKVTLSKEKSNRAKQLSRLTSQEKKLKQQVAAKRKAVAKLNSSITAAIKREIAAEKRRAEAAARARAAAAKAKADAAKKAGTATTAAKPTVKSGSVLSSTPAAAKMSSAFLSNRGRLPWPVRGPIVSRYGISTYRSVKIQNNGIDIKTSVGASVKAIFPGEVRLVSNSMSGYMVLIRHGEYFTVFANLGSVTVSSGQNVSAGQTIGTVRTDSDDQTTHLHLEIWKNTSPTNPEGWLSR